MGAAIRALALLNPLPGRLYVRGVVSQFARLPRLPLAGLKARFAAVINPELTGDQVR
jgi:hypothetical protein